jgi:hypothetical protein
LVLERDIRWAVGRECQDTYDKVERLKRKGRLERREEGGEHVGRMISVDECGDGTWIWN